MIKIIKRELLEFWKWIADDYKRWIAELKEAYKK